HNTRRPRTLLRIFTLLLDVAPDAALKLWRTSARRGRGFGRRERMIVFVGLMAFPRDGWEASFARLRRASRGARIRFFAEHAGWLDHEFRGWSSVLTEQQLADLYLLLIDLFPPNTLSDYSQGGSL